MTSLSELYCDRDEPSTRARAVPGGLAAAVTRARHGVPVTGRAAQRSLSTHWHWHWQASLSTQAGKQRALQRKQQPGS